MADLTSVANVKAQTGGNFGTASDAVLAALVTQASTFFQTATRRKFDGTTSFSEIRNGSGGTELYLKQAPDVTAIATLTVDTVGIPAQPADGQPGYFLIEGTVLGLSGYRFTRGKRNVRLTYTYGFAVVPKDVEQAVIEMVVSAYRRVPRGPDVQSETYPQSGAVTSFKLLDLPVFAARVLNEYQRVAQV